MGQEAEPQGPVRGRRRRTGEDGAERMLGLPGARVLCRCPGFCSHLAVRSAHGWTCRLACASAGLGSFSLGPPLLAHWPSPEGVLNKFFWRHYSIFKIL